MLENDIKQIVIDGHRISLVGLQESFIRIKEMGIKDRAQLKEQIVREIEKQNYIAPSFKEKYAAALYEEYQLFIGEIKERKERGPLTIRVVGPGCYNCEKLFELTLQILSEMGISADLDKITDPAIQRQCGVSETPAFIINGKVKAAGRIPVREEMKKWITGAITERES